MSGLLVLCVSVNNSENKHHFPRLAIARLVMKNQLQLLRRLIPFMAEHANPRQRQSNRYVGEVLLTEVLEKQIRVRCLRVAK